MTSSNDQDEPEAVTQEAFLACVTIDADRTVADLDASWDSYLTIGEGLYLAAQAFTRDVSTLSCCAD